ncbi:hypothetical protein GCM10027275_50330 [Rhabdobacter roseus]|uniref:Uncharacterized protein n=1 Tax=Rhabdobacter roseus TaxID=1655419 RepID=A0A840TW05_9BACT|nr:hypothetical protein [Rhabdobacter roseus]MBB5287105.1 hypothetical protein [Rhabdobacter roseus]
MKRLFFFLILLGLTDCRTMQQLHHQVDSSAVRSEQSAQKWSREVITEYALDTLWRTRYDTIYKYRYLDRPVPYEVPVYRTITRESGEASASRQEEKQVSVDTKEKEAHLPLITQLSFLLCAISVLGAIGLGMLTLLRR